jgi:hypothetical protein
MFLIRHIYASLSEQSSRSRTPAPGGGLAGWGPPAVPSPPHHEPAVRRQGGGPERGGAALPAGRASAGRQLVQATVGATTARRFAATRARVRRHPPGEPRDRAQAGGPAPADRGTMPVTRQGRGSGASRPGAGEWPAPRTVERQVWGGRGGRSQRGAILYRRKPVPARARERSGRQLIGMSSAAHVRFIGPPAAPRRWPGAATESSLKR